MAFTYTPPKILGTFQKKMEDQNIPEWQKTLRSVQSAYQAPTIPTVSTGGASMVTPPNAPVQPQIAPTAQTTGQPPITPPSAVLGATAPAVTVPPIPTPTKDINLAIPQTVSSDIIAGAPTSGQVLTKAKSLASQYQEFLTQQQAQQQSSLQAQTPTAQEQALTQQINTLNQQAREAITQAEESGVTGRFAAGETARASRQATIQMQGLSDQLNALTAQRSVRIDALKTQMDFNKENMDAITNLSKLSQPDVISTGIDKKTGQIYSLVKDPQTGEITQNIIGQVTPEEAKLDLLKTFVDQNGNEVASFLGPNNTIVNRVLGKAQMKEGEGFGVGVNGVGGAGAGVYSGVISTILGSGKFTKDQATAMSRAINAGEDPITVIKNQAKNILGQTEGTKITNYEVAKTQLQDVDELLRQFYANGGKTSIFSGNFEKVINKLGEVDNPKLVEMATQIQSALQIYRNAVSGTAYSVQEGKDISSIFPGINKSEGLNKAILKGRMAAFDSTINGSYRAALGSAYDNLKSIENTTTQETPKLPENTMNDMDSIMEQKKGYFSNLFGALFGK